MVVAHCRYGLFTTPCESYMIIRYMARNGRRILTKGDNIPAECKLYQHNSQIAYHGNTKPNRSAFSTRSRWAGERQSQPERPGPYLNPCPKQDGLPCLDEASLLHLNPLPVEDQISNWHPEIRNFSFPTYDIKHAHDSQGLNGSDLGPSQIMLY